LPPPFGGHIFTLVEVPVLRTDSLTRDFGSIRAVDDVSLCVPKGSLFGFLGPNGAGKTTIIRLLLGLLRPTSGSASVLGYDTGSEGQQIRSRVGALLEHTGLYEQLNAVENLNFFARIWHIPKHERYDRIRNVLVDAGLWDRKDEPVARWSRGMRQRLAIARTLIHRPSLVMLDEPTAGLDVVAAKTVRSSLRSLVGDHGVTVIITTHNMAEAERLCDQVAVIRDGKLAAIDHPDRLRTQFGRRCVEIAGEGFGPDVLAEIRDLPGVGGLRLNNGQLEVEFDGPVDSAPIVTLLVERGAAIQEVRKRRASLEDVFLSLVEAKP
jgi:ABC-2 type transport system ATP-binding protein